MLKRYLINADHDGFVTLCNVYSNNDRPASMVRLTDPLYESIDYIIEGVVLPNNGFLLIVATQTPITEDFADTLSRDASTLCKGCSLGNGFISAVGFQVLQRAGHKWAYIAELLAVSPNRN